MKKPTFGKVSIAVVLLTTLLLVGDALVIYLGPKTLGAIMLLTTLMSTLAAFFWLLRFGDEQVYFRKNPAILFLGIFFFAIGSLLAPFEQTVVYDQNVLASMSEVLMGPLKAGLLVFSLIIFAAFVLVCAALERN